MEHRPKLFWPRVWWGIQAVFALGIGALGILVIVTRQWTLLPMSILMLGFGALGAGLLWRSIVGWKKPSDAGPARIGFLPGAFVDPLTPLDEIKLPPRGRT